MIHQNLAGKPIALSGNPTASHGTPFAGPKNLRASTGTPFAKAGEPLASHGNANVGLGNGVAVRQNRSSQSWSGKWAGRLREIIKLLHNYSMQKMQIGIFLLAMNEEEIKYCKIGNASAIAAIIGALFFWGLTFEFAVGKIAFFGGLVSAFFSVVAVIAGVGSFIFGKKDHSKRYATFAVLAGCIFAFFTILPLVSMIKSAKQKAEIMRELETTRDFTIED